MHASAHSECCQESRIYLKKQHFLYSASFLQNSSATDEESLPMSSPIAQLWSQASEIAEKTPASRNRYVDFLRAASILVVILGHWLMAAPYLRDEDAYAQRGETLRSADSE